MRFVVVSGSLWCPVLPGRHAAGRGCSSARSMLVASSSPEGWRAVGMGSPGCPFAFSQLSVLIFLEKPLPRACRMP